MDLQSYIQLKEAYANVHAPKVEVTTEEVDSFIDALLEEGYDLSEFTWEEVRESYLSEKAAWNNPATWRGLAGDAARTTVKMFGTKDQIDALPATEKRIGAEKERIRKQQQKQFGRAKPGDMDTSTSGTSSSNKPADKSGNNKPSYKGPGGNPSGSGEGQAQQRSTGTGASGRSGSSSSSSSRPVAKAKPVQTAQQKADASTNSQYDKLRKSDPAAAKKFGMAASQKKFGNQLKPKTPNPLMKGMGTASTKPSTTPKPATTPKPTTSAADSSPVRAMSKSAPTSTAPKPKATPIKSSRLNKALSSVGESVEVDSFDIILEYLVDSGFPQQEALVIMSEMSEEKREEILENRRAASNPESQGSDRKYEKVRGERTPMPPRGDKRREDFEKWYATQMRKEEYVSEGGMKHRDAETGEVTDKPEIGKTYYPHGERQKSSVALRKEKEREAAKKKSVKEEMAELAAAYQAVYSEESSDTEKDKHLERGGHSAKTDYSRPPKTDNTFGKKAPMGEKDRSEAMAKIVSNMKNKKDANEEMIREFTPAPAGSPIDRHSRGISKYDKRSERQIRMDNFASKRSRIMNQPKTP